MKKSDLKSGDIVKTSYNKKYMVLKDCRTHIYGDQDIVFVSIDGFLVGEDYDEDLNFIHGNEGYDLTFVKTTEISGRFLSDVRLELE